jgi:lauroyl/myristoyl acyltransferase
VREQPDAPFGRGPVAARVLERVIGAASAAGARLPPRTAHRLAVAGGTLEWAARSRKRRTLAENLGHAVGLDPSDPRLRALVRREIVNEAHRSADLLWSIGRPAELLERVRIEGREGLDRALVEGRGVILAGPHIGGWEVVVPVPAAELDVPVAVLVSDDWLAWAVEGLRRRAGLEVEYVSDGPRPLVRRLRRGEVLLMFADIVPDPGVRTIAVRFLDGVARLPAGPAALARMGDAVIVPLAVLPLDQRAWKIELGEPIHPRTSAAGPAGADRDTLQRLADAWSDVIRRGPEWWAAVYPLAWER